MNVLLLDLETTGRDTAKDKITEIGCVVWNTAHKAILDTFTSFIHPGEEFLPLSEEIVEVTGIRDEWLRRYGVPFESALSNVLSMLSTYQIEYIAAHNAYEFDRPMLEAEFTRQNWKHLLMDIPWVDTMCDLPFLKTPKSRSLESLAVYHGFLNPFPHRALMDALTLCKILSHYDFEEVIALSKEPFIYLQARVDYTNREKAKELRYSWEKLGDRDFPKAWVKKVREKDAGKEELSALKKGLFHSEDNMKTLYDKTPLSTYVTPQNKKWLLARAKKEKLPLCKILDKMIKEARAAA